MSNSKYNISPEFHKLPSFNLSYKRWMVGLLNVVIKLSRMIRRNKSSTQMVSRSIPRADGSQLPIIVITPAKAAAPLPCLLYYHGGAFALTYGPMHIEISQQYSELAECCVVFVDYRLMPAHPFPDAQNDCHLALEWVVNNAEELGINPQRIAVGGDSAGGKLSASVCHMSKDRGTASLCGQLLIYPVTDMDCKTQSATTFTDVPIFTSVSNSRMWDAYLRNSPKGTRPEYASPAHREDCSGVPAAYVETAEFDPLHDEGVNYAQQLIAEGIEVELNETKGTVHGWDATAKSALFDVTLARRVAFLQRCFSSS